MEYITSQVPKLPGLIRERGAFKGEKEGMEKEREAPHFQEAKGSTNYTKQMVLSSTE